MEEYSGERFRHKDFRSQFICFVIAIRVDFRQSLGGSISITAQCIETQLMPNESSRKDIQIMCGHFYVRSLLHGVICVTKCQRPSNCFS